MVNFQFFPDSAHQAELERYQGHTKLDDKYPYHGAHGRLTYDSHDKTGYHTSESIIPRTVKLTQKTKTTKKQCVLIGKFNWKENNQLVT